MNTKLVKLLGFICGLFVLLLAGEWVLLGNSQKQVIAESSNVKAEEYQPDEMPSLDLSEQTEDNYADLVNRPLFVKGRRPVEEAPADSELAPAAADVPFDWQLSGVYSSSKGLTALFSRTKTRVPKDNYRRLHVGADLDGWKLTILEKDRVLLKQGDTEKPLPLRKIKVKPPGMPGVASTPGMPNMPGPNFQPPMPMRASPVPTPAPVPEIPQGEPQNVPIEQPQDPFENTTNE